MIVPRTSAVRQAQRSGVRRLAQSAVFLSSARDLGANRENGQARSTNNIVYSPTSTSPSKTSPHPPTETRASERALPGRVEVGWRRPPRKPAPSLLGLRQRDIATAHDAEEARYWSGRQPALTSPARDCCTPEMELQRVRDGAVPVERHQPRRPTRPRLPVRPGDAALLRRRPRPSSTVRHELLNSKHKSSSLAGIGELLDQA